jgi:DNA-binding transcriptional ArsR family regulator
VLSQEQERRILLYLVERSSCTQKELVKYTGVSASTINWHMKRLIDARLVNAKREAQFVRYELAVEKERVLKLLIIQEFGKDLQKLYPK